MLGRATGRLDQSLYCLRGRAALESGQVDDAAAELDEPHSVLGQAPKNCVGEAVKVCALLGEESQHLPWREVLG